MVVSNEDRISGQGYGPDRCPAAIIPTNWSVESGRLFGADLTPILYPPPPTITYRHSSAQLILRNIVNGVRQTLVSGQVTTRVKNGLTNVSPLLTSVLIIGWLIYISISRRKLTVPVAIVSCWKIARTRRSFFPCKKELVRVRKHLGANPSHLFSSARLSYRFLRRTGKASW